MWLNRNRRRAAWLAGPVLLLLHDICPVAGAYTAAGDRIFPATVLLPQIGPTDEAYFTGFTVPQDPSLGDTRDSSLAMTWSKTITDRLSLTMTGTYSANQLTGGGTAYGWQNFDTSAQYLAVVNPAHEFLMSFGLDQNFGGTGAIGVGASRHGSTTPAIYLGKGLGDYDIGLLRPLAIAGFAGYQIADSAPASNAFQSGLVVEYSFPYLVSKVAPIAMPDFLRATTLMCEFEFNNPIGGNAAKASVTVAPGFNYAGQGWDIGLEALLPATSSAGRGIGVIAQLHFSLDYLMPNSIGRPLL